MRVREVNTLLEHGLDFIVKLDKWLCLPNGAQKVSQARLKSFANDCYLFHHPIASGGAFKVPKSLPVLANSTLSKRLEAGTLDLACPLAREAVVIAYIGWRTGASRDTCVKVANIFLKLELA